MPLPHRAHRARKLAKILKEEGQPVTYRHDWKYICGTIYEMPIDTALEDIIKTATSAVKHAQGVRAMHGRNSKRGTPQREADLSIAVERLREAMRPIRRRAGRSPYTRGSEGAESLRAASEAIQRERRKLWKMKQKKKPMGRPPKPKLGRPKHAV